MLCLLASSAVWRLEDNMDIFPCKRPPAVFGSNAEDGATELKLRNAKLKRRPKDSITLRRAEGNCRFITTNSPFHAASATLPAKMFLI